MAKLEPHSRLHGSYSKGIALGVGDGIAAVFPRRKWSGTSPSFEISRAIDGE